MSDRLILTLGRPRPLQPFNGIHYTLNRSGCQITDRDVCLVIAIEGTERDGETVGPATDDLQRDIGLVAMDADEETDIDLILPDGQIRMVRVDLLLRNN